MLKIVEGCADAETHPKPPYRERKQRYLGHLAAELKRTVQMMQELAGGS